MRVPVQLEQTGELPVGWRWERLQDLTLDSRQDIVDGPFGSNLKASEYVDQGVPIARLQNVDRNQFIDKNIRRITEEKAAQLARHRFQPGDILLTKLGDPLGKACIVPPAIGTGIVVADLIRIRPDLARINLKYLTYALNSPAVIRQFERHTKGTTRPRVNLNVVRELAIPVAPRDEQDSVVAEIETQFSRLDEAVANLTRVKADLRRYKVALFRSAVEGRLVPTEAPLALREGRNYESGAELLKRALEDRRAKWRAGTRFKDAAAPKRPEGVDLPDGWTWATLEQLCTVFVDCAHRTPIYGDGSYPAIGPRDVVGGVLNLERARHVNESEYLIQVARHVPKGGDIVYSRELSLGWGAMLPDGISLCLSQGMCLFRPTECISAKYFLIVLNSPFIRGQAASLATGSAHPHLNLSDIKALVFPLPPLPEQGRIVSELERIITGFEHVEKIVEASLGRAGAMRRAIGGSAFRTTAKCQVEHDLVT